MGYLRISKVALTIFLISLTSPACAQNLSYEKKSKAIESLKQYHSSKRSKKVQSKPFECVESTIATCEKQKESYDSWNSEPQSLDQKFFTNAGRYKIQISFQNDINVPDMYWETDNFKSKSAEESAPIKTRIFEHFLGNQHKDYSPYIRSSGNGSVLIVIELEDPKELDVFLNDSKVQGIWHIANSENIEEAAI